MCVCTGNGALQRASESVAGNRTDWVKAAMLFVFLLITVGRLLTKKQKNKKTLYPLDGLHNAVLIHKDI